MASWVLRALTVKEFNGEGLQGVEIPFLQS